jgi:transcriptional regulator GlxA family with amidase domain
MVQPVGLTEETRVYDRLFSVRPDLTIENVQKTNLIIIPAVKGDMDEVISMNKGYLPWIARQHKAGTEVASLCVGAFLLAATGLVKGRQCATHWLSANDFRRRPESIITKVDCFKAYNDSDSFVICRSSWATQKSSCLGFTRFSSSL